MNQIGVKAKAATMAQTKCPGHSHSVQATAAGRDLIEIHLRELRQLFDAMDPSPFYEKDLDSHAEHYIVESAKELPAKTPCQLMIYLDQQQIRPEEEQEVAEAIRAHFVRLADLRGRDLRQLLRRGWISLLIGMAFLATVFGTAQIIRRWNSESPWSRLLHEGLMIFGWVAMWRPLEIFLYDWWPILGQKRLCERLAKLEVRISSSNAT